MRECGLLVVGLTYPLCVLAEAGRRRSSSNNGSAAASRESKSFGTKSRVSSSDVLMLRPFDGHVCTVRYRYAFMSVQ